MMISASAAWAARPARVDVDELPVFQELKPDSPIIRTLIRGTRVIVSNNPTQGFYRIRTNEGEVGWISGQGLQLLERPTAEQVKAVEEKELEEKEEAEDQQREKEDADADAQVIKKKRSMLTMDFDSQDQEDTVKKTRVSGYRHWMLDVFYGFSYVDLGGLRSLTGLDLERRGSQLGIELQYQYKKSWIPFILRIESISVSGISNDSSNNVYNMSVSSAPIMLGVRLDLLDENNVSIDVSALVGASFNQDFKLTVMNQASPNTMELSGTAFAAMLKGNINYRFASDWFGFFELGFRSLRSGSPTYSSGSSSANGNAIMMRNGSLLTVPLDLSGLMASLGVSYRF
jgi:hypothetical protein